jgi:hypothetical protein
MVCTIPTVQVLYVGLLTAILLGSKISPKVFVAEAVIQGWCIRYANYPVALPGLYKTTECIDE